VKADFFANTELEGDPVHSAYFSRIDHDLVDSSYPGVPDINYSIRFTGNFMVDKSGNYQITVAGDDGYRVFLNGKKVIEYWQNQSETVRRFDANLVAGKENHFVVEFYQAGGDASIRFGYSPGLDMKSHEEAMWNEAVDAAKKADFVVLSAGFNEHTEHEGQDRTMELPYGQDKLIAAMAELNKNCIVVINAGGNITMPWYDKVSGLLYAWYPGQEGNIPVAEILFGKISPSGKLPVSFEKEWADNATYNSYFDEDKDGKVYFSEGIFLGYRHFDRSDVKPRFPFGYGLSYTTFEYSDIELNHTSVRKGSPVKVTFSVKNTGEYDGAEIAQVYVSDLESGLERPVKELKGFEKVFLKKGETKKVTVDLCNSAFSYYDPDKGGWITEPGDFRILVGSSSQDIRLNADLSIKE
jgi:beta-glucosidase